MIIGKIAREQKKTHINLQISFYIKEYAKRIKNWDGREETKPRQFLQYLGTEIIRNTIDEYLFIRRIDEDIRVYSNFFDVITISDIRLKTEIDFFKEKYPKKTVLIHILRNDKIKKHSQHRTETELEAYQDFDYVIDNNGTIAQLEKKLHKIVEGDR